MKNATNAGFEQHYNAQIGVSAESLFIVGQSLSNHPTDQGELLQTVDSIPAELGVPTAGVADTGFWRVANVAGLDARGSAAYIATGRTEHRREWHAQFAPEEPPSLPAGASVREVMAHKLGTAAGRAVCRRRKCTVEPVIGIIKEVRDFRQFSLRGLPKAAGEWCLVCLAYNLKRLHRVSLGLTASCARKGGPNSPNPPQKQAKTDENREESVPEPRSPLLADKLLAPCKSAPRLPASFKRRRGQFCGRTNWSKTRGQVDLRG